MSRLKQLLVAILIALFAQCHSSTTAQDELLTEEPDQYRIYGKVIDNEGNPVANASSSLVIMPMYYDMLGLLHKPASMTRVATEESGQFDIQIPSKEPMWNSVNERTEILLVVQADGYTSAARKVDRERLLVDLPIEIKIAKSRPLELKVIDSNGNPAKGVSVKSARISAKKIPFNSLLSTEIRTDENGTVALPDVDSTLEVFLSSETHGNHRVAVSKKNGQSFVQIPKVGTVKGKFKLPEDADPTAIEAKEVFVATGDPYATSQNVAQPMSWCMVKLDHDASFEANHLGFGQVQYQLLDLQSTPFCTSSRFYQTGTLAEANTPMDVTQQLFIAKLYKVRYVDESGKPLERIFNDTLGVRGETGAEGIVTFQVAAGEKPSGQIFPYDATGRYQVTNPFGANLGGLTFENSEPATISMTRSRSIKGRVVDEQGNVVAGAEIQYSLKTERFTLTRTVASDQSGDFRINGLAPNTAVKISAKKGNSATPEEEVANVMSGSVDVVTIGIVPQQVAAITGTLKNQSGDPIANAKVKLFKAAVSQEEGFAAEDLSAVELLDGFEGVTTDLAGNFRYPPTPLFKERIQVVVSAAGYRDFHYPFIDGSRKELNESAVDLGEFELFALPVKKSVTVSVRSADTGDPVPDAKIVLIGIDSGKQVATSDNKGLASLDAFDTGQLLAVDAKDHQLHLQFIENLSSSLDVSLAKRSEQSESLPWLDRPWQDFHAAAKELLAELDVPAPKESTYYRQSTYFASQINADFPAFREMLSKPNTYENQQYFLMFNAGPIFLNAPQEAIELLRTASLPPEQEVALIGQFALLSNDAELKEELYGEAIVLLDECSGSKRQLAAGQLATSLVIDGNVEIAKELISDEWDAAVELRNQLDSETPKTRIGESRVFVPLIAMFDPEAAIKLTRLTGNEQEVPGLLTQCLSYASIAGGDNVDAICKKHDIELNLNGFSRPIESTNLSLARYDSTAKWIEDHVDSMSDTANKVTAIFFAARHMPEGRDRRLLLEKAIKIRKSCLVSYSWDDPARVMLTELPKFHSFPQQLYDDLLFEVIEHAPEKTDTMQLNGVYANLIKMVAVRDRQLAKHMLDPAFQNGAWLHGDPRWSAFEFDELLKVYAWIDPKIAAEKAKELAKQYAVDDSVRKLQLLTKVVSELNEIAIRKGMLQRR